jgi:exodeoxyribonuclease VII small subunit
MAPEVVSVRFRITRQFGVTPISPQVSSNGAPSKGAGKTTEELSFEGALKELEAIVSRLEQGEVDLEDSIALYERGQVLKSYCEKKLKTAEGRLEKIVQGAAGPEIDAPENNQSLETA